MPDFADVNALKEPQFALVTAVCRAALQAVDPATAVGKALSLQGSCLMVGEREFDLSAYRQVRIVGFGKAVQSMGRGAYSVLGQWIHDGVLVAKHLEDEEILPSSVRLLAGNHPVPGEGSIAAGQAVAEFLSGCQEDDLVLCLISGGGSALLALPRSGTTLADLQELTRLLLASGADIQEVNCLRKHLDVVKGGGLARLAHPAALVGLILSDVIDSPLDSIASGPTVADPTTYGQALAVLEKYGLIDRAPRNLVEILRSGAEGNVPETVKTGDPVLERVTNVIVGDNPKAARAALAAAEKAGFQTLLLTTSLQGEASQAGTVLASILRQAAVSSQPVGRPACMVVGGETTVTLRGDGLGGRNQEMALSACLALAGISDTAFVTLGTDGEDGPTSAAGAVVTGETLARARGLGLDPLEYLRRNDAYHFFERLGDLLVTGPTGTNVNDLAFLWLF